MADENRLEIIVLAKDEATKVLEGIGGAAKSVFAVGLAAGAVAVAGLTAAIGFSIAEAIDHQKVMAQTVAVLNSTKGAAGMTADSVWDLASAMSKVTTFGEEEIATGENLLLTFTNIGKNVFPQTTQVMLDMSQALGQDLKSSAIQLGKALQDPVNGITALRRVGVNFTEAQQKMIQSLVDAGKVEEAQKLILQELQTEFGGSAEAAGKTFAGQITIMKNRVGEAAEVVGTALMGSLVAIQPIFDGIVSVVEVLAQAFGQLISGDTTGWIETIRTGLAGLIPPDLINGIINVIQFFLNLGATVQNFIATVVVPFVSEHAEAFKAAFIAIGAVLGGLAVLGAIMAVVGAIGALLNPVTLIIAAIALLAAAWTENWGGIRTTLTEFWEKKAKPIFDQVVAWLQVNIPIAIQKASDFWNNILHPALINIWNFISTKILPIFQQVWDWLSTNIPAAINTAKAFWEGVLLPAITSIWNFINTYLVPIFNSIVSIVGDAWRIVITAAQGLWENVLLPAITKVWNFFNTYVVPILNAVVGIVRDELSPKISALSTLFSNLAKTIEGAVKRALEWVADKLQKLADFLKNFKLPGWLIGNSPSPFELSLRGISDALTELNTMQMPAFQMNLMGLSSVSPGGSTNNWSFVINNPAGTPENLFEDYLMIRAMSGA